MTDLAPLMSIEFSKDSAARRIMSGRKSLFRKRYQSNPQLIEARMLMVFHLFIGGGQKQKAREEVARAPRREAPDEPVVHFVKATLHRLDGEYGPRIA